MKPREPWLCVGGKLAGWVITVYSVLRIEWMSEWQEVGDMMSNEDEDEEVMDKGEKKRKRGGSSR